MVDLKDQDMSNYEQDLSECQEYAKQINPAVNAAAGVALGVVVSVLVAVVLDVDALISVVLGVIGGAASGGVAGGQNQRTIISNCLLGRGYKVLN
jgi:hypothetical protein